MKHERPHRPSIHVIGGVMVDLIMGPVTPWPRPGTETFVDHSELRAGGPAGNTGLALKALGVPHHIVCNVGNDMFGAWLIETFGEVARTWPQVATPTALSVGVEHPGGERSFLTTAGNLAVQTPESMLAMLPEEATAGDIALLTGSFLYLDLIEVFEAMLATVSARGFAVALDTGWPSDGWTDTIKASTVACLAHCDHVLLNEIESLSLSGEQTVEAAAMWLARRAKPGAIVVVKRGGDGASAWRDGEVTHVPAPAVAVIDTTGAGDTFNAGYLGALLDGATLEDALRAGVAVASAAIASSPRRYVSLDVALR